MGIFKRVIVVLTVLYLLAAVIPAGVSARMEARWALQSGDVLTGMDWSIQKPQAQLYHSSDNSLADSESSSITFPTAIDLSPSQDTGIALPSISQSVDQTASAVDTGYFHANWCYLNSPNNGGGPIVAGDPTLARPFASSQLIGSGIVFPYMTPIADSNLNFKPILNSSEGAISTPGIDHDSFAPFVDSTVAFLPTNLSTNMTTNQTNANQTGPSMQQGARKPKINPASTATEIKNMTDLQRMERNAFVGTTMYKAYQGDVQSPTWISPNDHPADVTKMKDHIQVNKDALNMTKSGSELTPVFWNL